MAFLWREHGSIHAAPDGEREANQLNLPRLTEQRIVVL